MPKISGPVSMTLAAIMLTGCAPSRIWDGAIDHGATEAELCRTWGESLPTRSRSDTARTADEIELGYTKFAAACPDFAHLIPD